MTWSITWLLMTRAHCTKGFIFQSFAVLVYAKLWPDWIIRIMIIIMILIKISMMKWVQVTKASNTHEIDFMNNHNAAFFFVNPLWPADAQELCSCYRTCTYPVRLHHMTWQLVIQHATTGPRAPPWCLDETSLGPLLLTWINFNPSMDE